MRTFIRQAIQIAESDVYDDTIAPTATAYETDPDNIEDDLNRLRSGLNTLLTERTGNWYDDLVSPVTFEGGAQRGVNSLNQSLHDLERKRTLRRVSMVGVDVAVPGGQNYVVIGAGDLPSTTTLAVGNVTTLGTIVAFHSGTFGTHSLDEVTGGNALQPKNLVLIVDQATGDAISDSSGNELFGLLQSESNVNGSTATTTTPNRLQISFVKRNGAGDDLVAAAVADIAGKTVDYAYVERRALADLPEEAFLGPDFIDAGASTLTRQSVYNNQGTSPVDLTTNATLDLENPGIYWQIRDDAETVLFKITEGSAGGTTEVQLGTDVDVFNVDAVLNDFANGIRVRTSGTRPIRVGSSDGVIETTSGDLELQAFGELWFDDGNKPGTWSLAAGMKFSEQNSDWATFETNFGEVSLLEALNMTYSAANTGGTRTKKQAVLTANVAADNNVNGPTYANNTDIDLAPYNLVNFVDDVEVYLNGELMRNAANNAGGEDVYPGTSATQGDLKFQFALKGTGAKPDQLTIIVNGQ